MNIRSFSAALLTGTLLLFTAACGTTDAPATAGTPAPTAVQTVQPAYSADLLVQTGEDSVVARAHSLPPDGDEAINRLVLAEGRLPQSPDECLVEVGATGLNPTYPLGPTFTVTAENEDLDSKLNRTQFTVVGLVHNSNYFSYEREPATVGSGAVQVVMYLQPDAFAYEAYTEIYLTAAGAKEQDSLTEPYRQTVQTVMDNIAAIQDERCQARYDGLLADARAELDDAWQKYYEAEADAEAQLADAAAQVVDDNDHAAMCRADAARGLVSSSRVPARTGLRCAGMTSWSSTSVRSRAGSTNTGSRPTRCRATSRRPRWTGSCGSAGSSCA